MNTEKKKYDYITMLRSASVPIMFIVICAVCIPIAGLSPSHLANEIVTRMGRNS